MNEHWQELAGVEIVSDSWHPERITAPPKIAAALLGFFEYAVQLQEKLDRFERQQKLKEFMNSSQPHILYPERLDRAGIKEPEE